MSGEWDLRIENRGEKDSDKVLDPAARSNLLRVKKSRSLLSQEQHAVSVHLSTFPPLHLSTFPFVVFSLRLVDLRD